MRGCRVGLAPVCGLIKDLGGGIGSYIVVNTVSHTLAV